MTTEWSEKIAKGKCDKLVGSIIPIQLLN